MHLEGKNVIYVGGFGGIGEKCVEAFLKSSVKSILIFDIKPNEEYLALLWSTYKDALVEFIPVDLTNRESIVQAFREAKSKVGSFDIVVNGAGVLDEDNADLVVSVNLTGLIHSSLIAMDYMSKLKGGQGGCIVNISSISGLDPIHMCAIYSATKCGVTAFTRAFASPSYFQKTGVSFVIICPGGTITPMLFNFDPKLLIAAYDSNFMEQYKIEKFQSPQVLADQFIKVLKKAENGTTWIIDYGEIKEIQFQNIYHPIIYHNKL